MEKSKKRGTVTMTLDEYERLVEKIVSLQTIINNSVSNGRGIVKANPMPDEIIAYEYITQKGRQRHWKYGDEGYGGSVSPKWWRDLPRGHNLDMIRQAVYRRVE